MNERLKKQLDFILEVNKLKSIIRQVHMKNPDRKENDAEHSWHLAMMASILSEYSKEKVDLVKTIKMLLIHDIVEIDAGDTFAFDKEAQKDKSKREQKAADRIFNLLPEDQAKEYRGLWDEFELGNTPEAKFAVAMDKFQPSILNYQNEGRIWKERDISKSEVIERNKKIEEFSEALWEYEKTILNDSIKKGWLKDA